jgi:hypothetical protein
MKKFRVIGVCDIGQRVDVDEVVEAEDGDKAVVEAMLAAEDSAAPEATWILSSVTEEK